MVMGMLSRIAGPRVLGGVILTAVVAVGLLFWQLQSAWADEAQAQTQATQLRSQLRQSEREITDLRKKQKQRERAISQAIAARKKARSDADAARKKLEAAIESNECANTRHPGVVADSLRIGAGYADGD